MTTVAPSTPPGLDYRLFDADEHYYEPEDALTRHLDRKYRSAVRWVDMDGRRSLIIDLSAVREIDSSGLGALVAILKWIRRFGGSMRVCGLQPLVREVVELTMLHRILPLHATLEEAMEEEAGRVHAGKGGSESI